jgi:hypothetical protein
VSAGTPQDFLKGNLKQTLQSARVNPISKRLEDHKFDEFADKVTTSVSSLMTAAKRMATE